jgi:hypothetical protein
VLCPEEEISWDEAEEGWERTKIREIDGGDEEGEVQTSSNNADAAVS